MRFFGQACARVVVVVAVGGLLLPPPAAAASPAGRTYVVESRLRVPGLEGMPVDCWRFGARGTVLCSRLLGCGELSILAEDRVSNTWQAKVRFRDVPALEGIANGRGWLEVHGRTERRALGSSVGGTLLGCFRTPLTDERRRECFNGGFTGIQDLRGCPSLVRTVYRSDFDDLALGRTEPYPGNPLQDGWYSLQAHPSGLGEIQAVIANGGQALHELAGRTGPPGLQTIDERRLDPPDLAVFPYISLAVDFYARTGDVEARNTFDAYLAVRGGPHPGFEVLGFSLRSGNGEKKSAAGVNVVLGFFNGVDNNQPLPLTVGQGLEWEVWHQLEVVADQRHDGYVSIRVDGAHQDLSAFPLPRSELGGVWSRGKLMEQLLALVVPTADFGASTDDSVYWDNVSLRVSRMQFSP